MALKIEEAMDMSLDEYIAMSKKPKDVVANKNVPNATINDGKFGRRRSDMDDDEDEDLDLLSKEEELLKEETSSAVTNDNDTGIWKGPDSSTAYLDCSSRQNDLRERINNNGRKQQISAIQYRLMAPNNSANRPRGLPTLLPLDAYVKQNNNGGYNNNNRNHNRGRNRNYRNRGFNNNNGNGGFNNNNNNKHFAGNGMGVVSNGRIQRNRNQDMSKNLRLTVNCKKSMATQQVNTPRNMFIECPSNTINLNPVPQFNSGFQRQSNQTQCGDKKMPVGNLTPQAQAALNLDSNAYQSSSGNVDNLKDLLGFQGNLPGDMMPVFASRLIDLIKNNVQPTVHKPIYDMKIQKDIHEIQNKPLVYKCPGGDVVSSDGAGVNCQIIPRTSGISLNCRFA